MGDYGITFSEIKNRPTVLGFKSYSLAVLNFPVLLLMNDKTSHIMDDIALRGVFYTY